VIDTPACCALAAPPGNDSNAQHRDRSLVSGSKRAGDRDRGNDGSNSRSKRTGRG